MRWRWIRVALGPGERAIFDLALNQIILRTLLHGCGGQRFILHAGQYDHHHFREPPRARAAGSHETMPIRQSHVQQDNVDSTCSEPSLGVAHTSVRRGQLEAARLAPC